MKVTKKIIPNRKKLIIYNLNKKIKIQRLNKKYLKMDFTFFSSLVGGFLSRQRKGAYMKSRIAILNSIHSKPIVLTRVPLKAGPGKNQNDFVHL